MAKESPGPSRAGIGDSPANGAVRRQSTVAASLGGSHRFAPSLPTLVAVGCLVVLVVAGWCAANAAWSRDSWTVPIGHLAGKPDAWADPEYGDTLFTLAFARAAADGRLAPWRFKRVPELGAPFAAEWSDWPLIEEPLAYLLGLLHRLFGPFAGLNVALLLGHILAAVTMFAVCRVGGAARPWAFVAGLAFGLAPFLFAQSPHHVTVAWAWHVPLFILVWRWAGDPSVVPGDRRFLAAAAIGFIAGVQNPYYTNILCQLALLSGAVAAWRGGSVHHLRTAGAVVAAAAGAFVLMHLDSLAFTWSHGPNPGGVVREYKWMEIYGLKLVDLFVPTPSHRSEVLAAAAARHRAAAPLLDEGASYLGMIGLGCLAWLAAVAARSLLDRRSERVPPAFWHVAWIVLAFTTGGLNAFAGAAGFLMFRTACRYSIVILAIVLEWAAREATPMAVGARPGQAAARIAWAAATGLSALAMWDEVPRPPDERVRRTIAERIDADRQFVATLEEKLPEGAMVFQLPLMEFPESPAPGVGPYEHLRPYVLGSRLHWSFGTVKGRPREKWLAELSKKDPRGVIKELRERGFAAIVIARSGFPDNARGLESALLEASGVKTVVRSPSGDRSCILLGGGS